MHRQQPTTVSLIRVGIEWTVVARITHAIAVGIELGRVVRRWTVVARITDVIAVRVGLRDVGIEAALTVVERIGPEVAVAVGTTSTRCGSDTTVERIDIL